MPDQDHREPTRSDNDGTTNRQAIGETSLRHYATDDTDIGCLVDFLADGPTAALAATLNHARGVENYAEVGPESGIRSGTLPERERIRSNLGPVRE